MLPVVVFDIGNVLIRYAPGPALAALTRRIGRSRWKVRWAFGRAGVRNLSRGLITPDEFLDAVNRRLETDLSLDGLRDIWGLDLPGPVEGMLDVLEETRHRTTVALLSDTNAFHWEHLALHYPVLDEVPHRFLSFREGLNKPDPGFFSLAEERLRTAQSAPDDSRAPAGPSGLEGGATDPAANSTAALATDSSADSSPLASPNGNPPILYFDDLPANIKAARSLGWDAHRFLNDETTREILRERGVLGVGG